MKSFQHVSSCFLLSAAHIDMKHAASKRQRLEVVTCGKPRGPQRGLCLVWSRAPRLYIESGARLQVSDIWASAGMKKKTSDWKGRWLDPLETITSSVSLPLTLEKVTQPATNCLTRRLLSGWWKHFDGNLVDSAVHALLPL